MGDDESQDLALARRHHSIHANAAAAQTSFPSMVAVCCAAVKLVLGPVSARVEQSLSSAACKRHISITVEYGHGSSRCI